MSKLELVKATNEDIKDTIELGEVLKDLDEIGIILSQEGRKEVEKLAVNNKLSVFNYCKFGHYVSNGFLSNNGVSIESYKRFVELYNNKLNSHFRDVLQGYKDLSIIVLSHRAKKHKRDYNIFEGMAYGNLDERLKIKDVTDVLNKFEFKKESILEDVIFEEFSWSIKCDYKNEGYEIVKQKVFGNNRSDLFIKLKEASFVIELKKGQVKPLDIMQSYNYHLSNKDAVPVVIGSKITKDALKKADELGVHCYEYSALVVEDSQLADDIHLVKVGDSYNSELDVFLDDNFESHYSNLDGYTLYIDYRSLFFNADKANDELDKITSIERSFYNLIAKNGEEAIKEAVTTEEENRCRCCNQILPTK